LRCYHRTVLVVIKWNCSGLELSMKPVCQWLGVCRTLRLTSAIKICGSLVS